MTHPAQELNTRVRAEIVELFRLTGRPQEADAAKEKHLIEVIGMVFAIIAEGDSALAMNKRQAQTIAAQQDELRLLRDSAFIIEKLNGRIAELNAQLMLVTTQHSR